MQQASRKSTKKLRVHPTFAYEPVDEDNNFIEHIDDVDLLIPILPIRVPTAAVTVEIATTTTTTTTVQRPMTYSKTRESGKKYTSTTKLTWMQTFTSTQLTNPSLKTSTRKNT